jgi:hypothetical protein
MTTCPTIQQQLAASLRAASTPRSYTAFLRRQGFTTEQVKAMVSRAFPGSIK